MLLGLWRSNSVRRRLWHWEGWDSGIRHTTIQEEWVVCEWGLSQVVPGGCSVHHGSTDALPTRCHRPVSPCSHPASSAILSSTEFPWSGILLPTPAAGVPGAQVTMIPLCFEELVCGKNKTSTLIATQRPSSLLAAWLPLCTPPPKPCFEEKLQKRTWWCWVC